MKTIEDFTKVEIKGNCFGMFPTGDNILDKNRLLLWDSKNFIIKLVIHNSIQEFTEPILRLKYINAIEFYKL